MDVCGHFYVAPLPHLTPLLGLGDILDVVANIIFVQLS
jgi:hypothetical protein